MGDAKEKDDSKELRHSKSKSKKHAHKSSKHGKKHTHEKDTHNRNGKVKDSKEKKVVSLSDSEVGKCGDPNDGDSEDEWKILGMKLAKKKHEHKTKDEVRAKKRKKMFCIISSDEDDSGNDEALTTLPKAAASSNDCRSERKNINPATKPSKVPKDKATPKKDSKAAEEKKLVKAQNFLPKETMRVKRKAPKTCGPAPISKRRHTYAHICADDENDNPTTAPPSTPLIKSKTTAKEARLEAQEDGEILSSSDEFSDGFDEDLMGDQADRERLYKLSEMERESELYRRFEERETKKRQWEIIRKLKKNRAAEANKGNETIRRSQKRKEDIEKANSKNGRSTAMAALVKQREKRIIQASEQEIVDEKLIQESEECEILPCVPKRRKSTVKLRASDIYSDESCSSEDEEMDDDMMIKPTITTEFTDKITRLEELNSMFLSRANMEKFLYLPIFQATVLNSYVRIKKLSSDKENDYFIAQVIDIKESKKVYNLGNTISNKDLVLKYGNNTFPLSIAYISNEPFKEREFQKWLETCEKVNLTIPNLDIVRNKREEIQKALDYNLTDKDINEMVEQKAALRQGPINLALEKACLLTDRHSATNSGDTDHVAYLDRKIKELEKHNKILNKQRIIKRRESLKSIPSHFIRTKLPEAKLFKKGGNSFYDPYTRRPTRPKKVSTSVGKENFVFFMPSLPPC